MSYYKYLLSCTFCLIAFQSFSQKPGFRQDSTTIKKLTENLKYYKIKTWVGKNSIDYPTPGNLNTLQDVFPFLKKKKLRNKNPDFAINTYFYPELIDGPSYRFLKTENEWSYYEVQAKFILTINLQFISGSNSFYSISLLNNKKIEKLFTQRIYNGDIPRARVSNPSNLIVSSYETNIGMAMNKFTLHYKEYLSFFIPEFQEALKNYKLSDQKF